MKLKAAILFFAYFAIGVISLSVTGCNWLTKEIYICGIEFYPVVEMVNADSIPEFTDKIEFQVSSTRGAPSCYLAPINFFTTAVATSINYVFQNKLIISSYELVLDKAVVLEGDTIPPNTDLLMNEIIMAQTIIDYFDDSDYAFSNIRFNTDLVEILDFESGVYHVNFKCATDDGKEFENTTQVVFRE